LLAYVVLVYAAFKGPRCGSNPFRAASLEWQSSSPPDFHNFTHKLSLNDPYDFDSQVYDEELDTWVPKKLVEPAPETTPAPAAEPARTEK
jgi:cytochrome c oxidase subunit 1